MSRFPNPVGDVLGKASSTLENADAVLSRVERHLVDVDATLRDATDVLGEVRGLLSELREELHLLHLMPELSEQVREIHRALTGRQA